MTSEAVSPTFTCNVEIVGTDIATEDFNPPSLPPEKVIFAEAPQCGMASLPPRLEDVDSGLQMAFLPSIENSFGTENCIPNNTLLSGTTAVLSTPPDDLHIDLKRRLQEPSTEEPTPKRRMAQDNRYHSSFQNSPFKSPLLSRDRAGSSIQQTGVMAKSHLDAQEYDTTTAMVSATKSRLSTATTASVSHRKPFRSPLLQKSSTSTANEQQDNQSEARRIATLERKLQTLKQAYRIHSDTSKNSEQNLTQSIQKWKAAAQDSATEIWSLIKDGNASWGGNANENEGQDNKYQRSIYDDRGLAKGQWHTDKTADDPDQTLSEDTSNDEENFNDDTYQSLDPENLKSQNEWGLGNMLTSLGIPLATLSWNVEEEEFETN